MIKLEDFEHLLAGKGLLDIQEPAWKKMTVHHGKGCLEAYGNKPYNKLREVFQDLHNKAGVYAYRAPGDWIYIGISKDLRERLYQHLLESCADVPYGHLRYKDFFMKYPGQLELFYIELGGHDSKGNYLRSIVEKILQARYNPLLSSVKI